MFKNFVFIKENRSESRCWSEAIIYTLVKDFCNHDFLAFNLKVINSWCLLSTAIVEYLLNYAEMYCIYLII